MAINFPSSPSINDVHTENSLSWRYNGNAWLTVATSNIENVVATGSTEPRSLSDRFADTVNVKDFGAVGDGVTDDTAAIQAAIDYAGINGKGAVQFAASTYSVNQIDLKSDIHLIGVGSTIKQRTAGEIVLYLQDVNDVTIEGFEIDGNSLGSFGTGSGHGFGSGDTAIVCRDTSNITIKGNHIHNFSNMGICFMTPDNSSDDQVGIEITENIIHTIGARLTSVNTPAYTPEAGEGIILAIGDSGNRLQPKNKNIIISKNRLYDNFQTQISGGECDGIFIFGNELSDSDSNGIQIGTGTKNARVTHNFVHDYTALRNPTFEGRGISVHADGDETNFVVSNNIVNKAGLIGIDGRSANTIISNNIITDAGQNNTTSTSTAGILVLSSGVNVSNNVVDGSEHTGIDIVAGSTDVNDTYITDNRVKGSGKQGIHFRPTGSGVFNNLMVNSNIVNDTQNNGLSFSSCTSGSVSNNIIEDYNLENNGSRGINIYSSAQLNVNGNVINTTQSGSNDLRVDTTSSSIYVDASNEFNSYEGTSGLNSLRYTSNSSLSSGEAFKGLLLRVSNSTYTISLPPAIQGMNFCVSADTGGGNARLDPSGSDFFAGQAAGKYAQLSSGNSAHVKCIKAGQWSITLVDNSSVTYES